MTYMKKQALILATTNDFLRKFEKHNIEILKSMGYSIHYATNMNEPDYISDKDFFEEMNIDTHHIEIARSPFVFKNNKNAFYQLLNIIKKYNIQLIHCHTPVGGVLGRLAGKFYKEAIVIYTAHGFHFYRGAPLINRLLYYRVEKILAMYTDILIVINKEDYENAKKFSLKKGGYIYKIPGEGIDTEIFKTVSEEKKINLRKKYGVKEDEFLLVSVGELNENKNHKIVIDALKEMRDRDKDISKIKYWICGDGFLREDIKRYIKACKLNDTVVLYGYCNNVPEILGCADAAVFPSKREGLGMAGLESLSMGLPLIVSDNRGTREYMIQGKNGFICRHDSVEDFIRSIDIIRGLSKKEKDRMKIFCRFSAMPFDSMYSSMFMREIYFKANRMVEGE